MIALAVVVVCALLLAVILTVALGAASEERPAIPPDVMARIDATLPRDQETERWLANRAEMRS